ncbi:MAG: kinase [Bacillaceae bacterium]
MNKIEELTIFLQTVTEKRFIVAIDGLSRSGKTTFTAALWETLHQKKIPHLVFHIDDYITTREKRYNTGHEQWFEYYSLQWDVHFLRDAFFQQLKYAHQLTLPFYHNDSNTHHTQQITIPDTCLIIIEGVFLMREEWQNFFDYIVYIDCPREQRFLREKKTTQQNIEKFKERYWKAEDYYLNEIQPIKHANLVLKNEQGNNKENGYTANFKFK